MPIYVYRCENCTDEIEKLREIAERDHVERCPTCAQRMRRVEMQPFLNDYRPTHSRYISQTDIESHGPRGRPMKRGRR